MGNIKTVDRSVDKGNDKGASFTSPNRPKKQRKHRTNSTASQGFINNTTIDNSSSDEDFVNPMKSVARSRDHNLEQEDSWDAFDKLIHGQKLAGGAKGTRKTFQKRGQNKCFVSRNKNDENKTVDQLEAIRNYNNMD